MILNSYLRDVEMSDQLKIDNQIRLMHVLEDFVLKNIKYSGVGNQTSLHEHLKFCGVDLQEYRYEITELDKKYIYGLHAAGHYKETEQQQKYRTSAVQKIHLAEDENDTVEIPLIDRLPRIYDDILTEIKQFFTYMQSEEGIKLKQVEKLRKKAFHTYSMHNDCLNLNAVPKEILVFILKNQTGNQQQRTTTTIKQAFLQFTEEVLLDENKIAEYIEIVKKKKVFEKFEDVFIKKLKVDSIPFVKESLCQQRAADIKILTSQREYLENAKTILLAHDPDEPTKSIYIFNDHAYFDTTIEKLTERIDDYEIQINELKGIKPLTRKSLKKFTVDSEKCLRQHKLNDKSFYQMIKETGKIHKK